MSLTKFKCRNCGCLVAYRSRRRTFTEKYILPVMLLQPVRCADCFRRYYRPMFMPVRERHQPGVTHRAAA